MGVIGIGVGTATLGRRQTDAAGKVISETPARWDMDPAGGCVAIWPMNLETGGPAGPAEIFGDWDAAAYLTRALELIQPNRKINIPNLAEMVRRAAQDHIDICDYCQDCNCQDCIVDTWKGETDDE